PPGDFHPTVWMGRGLGAARRAHERSSTSSTQSFIAGALTVGAGIVTTGTLAMIAELGASILPGPARTVATAALLKPTFSLRALLAAGREVEEALRNNDLDAARRALSWHLVSRDTSALSASEVAGAAIESLSENLSDSFVAPLLWYRAGGLPAAYVYRFINTADAMLGYHTLELEWFGKAAARADDVANLVPARLTALLIAFAAPSVGGSVQSSLRIAIRDAANTPSPNAGWPMAAMAGALDVRLDKRSTDDSTRRLYVLNSDGRAAQPDDLARAMRAVSCAAALGLALIAAVPGGRDG
ncbi:MAG TPA: adenosylcobinamide-phosphate synthase CbiB, partial [Gemmatimonadaceae bacterium]